MKGAPPERAAVLGLTSAAVLSTSGGALVPRMPQTEQLLGGPTAVLPRPKIRIGTAARANPLSSAIGLTARRRFGNDRAGDVLAESRVGGSRSGAFADGACEIAEHG